MGKGMGKKLSRATSTRYALMRSLTRALIINGKINTTFAKAKFAQKFVEKLVKKAKENSLSARRRILAETGNDREVTEGLFKSLKESMRKSGFTRIIALPNRKGDAAKMARLELIDWKQIQPKVKDIAKKKPPAGGKEEVKTGRKRIKSKK